MQTFEKVSRIFRIAGRVTWRKKVQSRAGYRRVTWNGDSPYCVDGVLCRAPEELLNLLLGRLPWI